VGVALRLSQKEESEIRVGRKPMLNGFFDITNKHPGKNFNAHCSPCLPDIKICRSVGLYLHLDNKKMFSVIKLNLPLSARVHWSLIPAGTCTFPLPAFIGAFPVFSCLRKVAGNPLQ
jgi:hypothetical protein